MNKMEEINSPIKGSKTTMHFLNYFRCLNCKEIGNIPSYLVCNHIYCENCVSHFNMRQKDGDLMCPFCYEVTKKEDCLPELEMKLLLIDLKSSNDEEFISKYKYKLDFNSENCDFRNIVLFLLKFFSIENKNINNNKKKKCFKRCHLELKDDKFFFDNNCEWKNKPIFKAN